MQIVLMIVRNRLTQRQHAGVRRVMRHALLPAAAGFVNNRFRRNKVGLPDREADGILHLQGFVIHRPDGGSAQMLC
ncbi:hypothetical protein SDC9_124957 [bioreactor metagenome]|uniref:Uncharacterized protein n=1 Tax=bioreactor metagenome TaxID=1076179 RepID=A0A645CM22_9ZZZZ